MDSEVEQNDAEMQAKEESTEDEYGEETPAPSTTNATSKKTITLGFRKKQFELDYERMGPFVGQFLSGAILLLSVALDPQRQNYAYGIVAATISMVFSMTGQFLIYGTERGNQKIYQSRFLGDITIQNANSLFLFLWWLVATSVLTFGGPFLETGNGYLAAWAGFILSILGLANYFESIKDLVEGNRGFVTGLLIASIIQLAALPRYVSGSPEAIFALVVTCVTIIVILLQTVKEDLAGAFYVRFFRILAGLWVVSACLVTFRGPFLFTGNGYFSAWGGMFFCVKIATTYNKGAESEQTKEEPSADSGVV